ncbi:S8 family peptidase [Hoeflea halophila]|uniref:S8 family peptidase n=1 Tax=Hoeflea halophila TaxID=714899 RepID=UPI0015C99C87|nr:S8 family peptidase [Hoeflea halophila]
MNFKYTEGSEDSWCKVHYLTELFVHEKWHEIQTEDGIEHAADHDHGDRHDGFWGAATDRNHQEVYAVQHLIRVLARGQTKDRIKELVELRKQQRKEKADTEGTTAEIERLQERLKKCLPAGKTIVTETFAQSVAVQEPGVCVATTTTIRSWQRDEELVFLAGDNWTETPDEDFPGVETPETPTVPECFETPSTVTLIEQVPQIVPPEQAEAPGRPEEVSTDEEVPPTFVSFPREYELDDEEILTPEEPDLGLVKATTTVMNLATVDRATGTPNQTVQLKTLIDPPDLPLDDGDNPPAVASAYLEDVSGGSSTSTGAVPIVFNTTPLQFPASFDEGDQDSRNPADMTDEELDAWLDEGDPEPAGKPKKKAKTGTSKAKTKVPYPAVTDGTKSDGNLDKAESGFDSSKMHAAGRRASTKKSGRVVSRPPVPEMLKKDRTRELIVTVDPRVPLITTNGLLKKSDRKYAAPAKGIRVKTRISTAHLVKDVTGGNPDDEYEIIILVGEATVTWRSGDECGEFVYKGAERHSVTPFKSRETKTAAIVVDDLDLSDQDLGEKLKAALPKSDVAGSARFELEVTRAYSVYVRQKGDKKLKNWQKITEKQYARAIKGRLVEIPKKGETLSGNSDRTGKYRIDRLETNPKATTIRKDCGDKKKVSRLESVAPNTATGLLGKYELRPDDSTQMVLIAHPGAVDEKPGSKTPGLLRSVAGNSSLICQKRSFAVGTKTAFVVKVPNEEVDRFIEEAGGSELVESVEIDPCRNKEELDDPHYSSSGLWGQDFDNQWAIKRVGYHDGEDSAWALARADLSPVIVAVIDSGLDWQHPDLPKGSIWENGEEEAYDGFDDDGNGYIDDMIGWDFVEDGNEPWDQDGHGTFVAGIIGAAQNNGVGIAGINPLAQVMVLRALDPFGRGHASMTAEAIAYAVDAGARVINLSVGGRQPTNIEKAAIEYATANDVVIVVAAGNGASSLDDYAPAGLPGVITVSATDRDDNRAKFSNWGPQVDIAAPGVDVLSLRAQKTDLLALIDDVAYEPGEGIVGQSRAYFRASGTSFAAPIVAGTASLILSDNPDLTADQVKRMILNSARDIDTPGMDNYTGYGLLNAAAAITADPDYFVESRISGVEVVSRNGVPHLRLNGETDADKFARAEIQLGKSDDPDAWAKLDLELTEPRNGAIVDIPGQLFGGETTWTIRLLTVHEDGSSREARFVLTLG